MAEVLGRVTEWVSDDFPGWVKVEVTDADGRLLTFIDKVPLLVYEPLDPSTALPKVVWLACDARPESVNRVHVTLRHGLETVDGVKEFQVHRDHVR